MKASYKFLDFLYYEVVLVNQMILPTINSFDFSNPSVLNIQPIDTYSAQHQLFIENIKDAKSIEKGNLKL